MVEELTDVQHQEIERQLRARKADLQKQLTTLEQDTNTSPQDQPRTDTVARLNAVQEQAMVKASRQHYQDQLRQVQAALSALENGDYGYCQRCDEPIPFERLQIMPESLFCVNCQTKRELG